ERAADLVARMSLSQKGSQMISSPAPAISASALGGGALNTRATKDLAQYYWWNEGLHGYNRIDNGASVRGGGAGPANSTSYPQSLTVGSTWNPELYYQEALQVSEEIRERTSRNSLGNAIDLNFYSPTVNLQRDPRWGRNEESYSEDPYLTVKMGSQYVLGLEGKNQDGSMIDPDGYYRLHSTIKHYVANNSESNRLNGGATTSLDALRNYYLAPYRGIIKATDVSSVMTAYSSLNGEPCSYSSYLMDTMLRQTYGLSGHITSDCDAVGTMSRLNYRNPRTNATLTNVERIAGALAHGEDLECNGGYTGTGNYNSYSSQMVNGNVQTDKGLFTENTMDISLHRLLTARISTGEFDDGLALTQQANDRIAAQRAADNSGVYNQTPERLAIVEQVNNEGVVMLQNKDNFLPLNIPASGDYKVVIVGAWQTNMYLGLYSASANNTAKQVNIQKGITDAIKAKNPNASFTYITSDSVNTNNRSAIEAADVCVVVGGANNQYSAEDRDRSSIAMNNNQASMFSQVGQWNPNTVAVMEYCGPVETYTFADNVKSILWSSFGGLRKGVGFGNIIVGNVNPSGKLTATWFHSTNDLPNKLNYDLYPSGSTPGRTYMFYKGTAVDYPFGYGLSFTTYEYSNLKLDKTAYDANDTLKVSFDVKNTGAVAGKEIAQLYIAQPGVTAANRPIRRLEGFDKIELQPGETKTVSMEVAIPDLAYYNEADDCYSVDTGAYEVQVGKDSASANLTAGFTVSGAMDVYPELLTVKANAVGDTEKGIEERLIYDKGAVINPQLTVCMNNEKLYGYIIADQRSPIKSLKSTPLPEGMTFSYRSNRPSVVRVTGDEIKAVGPGVATVTVTGKLDGHTVSADFVVYVMGSAKIDGITVDGAPLAKFDPDKLSYSMTLEAGAAIPVVAAT
ncbi:MAG: glycoside hydrolase family 3 C-terminal domain-containing protein, partial [Oscillospiraceae bacterium]|nr:glycoside hydrolase family 3 C-terminal domain-containing protein [Oscillospiraceae bacterium]